MEKMTHLWNVNQFITKLNCSQSAYLQTFYIQKCRRIGQGMQMPLQNFGPSAMCPYCGSLWSTINHRVRISEGKPISRSIRKVMRSMNNNEKPISKFHKSLVQKCIKSRMNRLVFKCSVCLQSTKIPFDKPPREKIPTFNVEDIQASQKRKKKKSKDKTAGLNLSGILNSSMDTSTVESKETPIKKIRSVTNFITPTQKVKKLNINRLKDIVNHGTTPHKRKSLHSFLTELC
ncbi:uncharacterized protein LOC143209791 [Lasioglossum baleicum]|uniref:uncharacterized protein LOC143209791 n=1 Tax=Lasioglossum baleicum TaxID=434251 RepID=UPI003FCCC74D